MPPTLKDIAERTGLDISTVSRVLNNDASRGVSERKRLQVQEVAQHLGYRPHRSARALRMGRHFNIAYVLAESRASRSNLELPFARFRLYGIEETLTSRGYLLSLLRLDPESQDSIREKALHRHVDGLVFNFHVPSAGVIDSLREARMPAVVIDGDVFEQSHGFVSCILSDRKSGTYNSVRHLMSLGHRRIAFISADSNRQRMAGYLQALEEGGGKSDERLVRLWSDPDGSLMSGRIHGYRLAQELLSSRIPFTAIQAGSDLTASGVLDALSEAKIQVPGDVAVAGFDDLDILRSPTFGGPSLTTVYDPNFEMGQKGAELLLATIEQGADPQRVVLPTRLVIRESCGQSLRGKGGEATESSIVDPKTVSASSLYQST